MSIPTIVGFRRNGRNFGATFLDNTTGNNTGLLDLGLSGNVTILAWAVCDGASSLVRPWALTVGSGGSAVTLTPRADRSQNTELGSAGRFRAFDAVGVTLTGGQPYRLDVALSDGTPDNNAPIDLHFMVLSGGTAVSYANWAGIARNSGEVLTNSIASTANSLVAALGSNDSATSTLTGVSPTTATNQGAMFTRRAWSMTRDGAAGSPTISATCGVAVDVYAGGLWTVEGTAAAPVLSSPIGNATGNTAATIGVTSDTAPTTTAISYQILPAATAAPSAATIVGAPTGTITTGSAGALTKAITTLTTDTAVKVHFAQGTTSNVVSSVSFTPPTLASSGSLSAQTAVAGGGITWAGVTPDSQITNRGVGSGSWSIVSSPGFTVAPSINASTGVLSGGTADVAGTYAPQVGYTDSSTAGTNPTGGGAPPQTIVRTISLTVSAPSPTINTQPTAQTVSEGATATYTVSATSSGGALSYQWQRQAPGGGAFANVGTNSTSYTTAATVCATDHGAQVRVLVTDSNGTTQSATVGLTVNATSSTSRPGADVTVSGWTASTGTDLFAMIDEISPGDSDYITSPGLTGSTAPATFALAYPLAAGNRVVGVRARTDTGTATLRVYLLNDAGTVMGTTADQAITSTFATYSLPVTLSGAATRARIEVVV